MNKTPLQDNGERYAQNFPTIFVRPGAFRPGSAKAWRSPHLGGSPQQLPK